MSKEQWELYKEFCEFAHLHDNSGADIPNAMPGMKMFMDGTTIAGWDPIDDLSVVSPEYLTYIVLKAKEYWERKEME